MINRFAFPFPRPHSEFYYYLDNRSGLDLLNAQRGVEIHDEMLEEIRNNREKDYANAAVRGQEMQVGFLRHSLMISRMHYCIEMAAREIERLSRVGHMAPGRTTHRPEGQSAKGEIDP